MDLSILIPYYLKPIYFNQAIREYYDHVSSHFIFSLWPGLAVHGFLPGAGQQGTDLQLHPQCWLLLLIFLGHQGRWLINKIEEEEESLNLKKICQEKGRVSAQEPWTFNWEKTFWKRNCPWKGGWKTQARRFSSVTNVTTTSSLKMAWRSILVKLTRTQLWQHLTAWGNSLGIQWASPPPPSCKKCRQCFSKPPLSICTEHFCKQCCIEADHLFKVHGYRWTVIQLWPKSHLWPRESTECQLLKCVTTVPVFSHVTIIKYYYYYHPDWLWYIIGK